MNWRAEPSAETEVQPTASIGKIFKKSKLGLDKWKIRETVEAEITANYARTESLRS